MTANDTTADVLMITYNRAGYTQTALTHLLANVDDKTRIWLWHNGDDADTLDVVHEHRNDVFRFHHSVENVRLRPPTNWLFENATGGYVSKVDDDCIVPPNWVPKLREAHEAHDRLGVIGCWRFQPEDYVPELAERKIRDVGVGERMTTILQNPWIEGSGYLMKRSCVERHGSIRTRESFTDYCVRLTRAGWINGWLFPFLYQEHMDDPRAEHSGLKSDADLQEYLPLSAKNNGIESVDEWVEQIKRSAVIVQRATLDPAHYSSRRMLGRHLRKRARNLVSGSRKQW